jgi:hypothetical protein
MFGGTGTGCRNRRSRLGPAKLRSELELAETATGGSRVSSRCSGRQWTVDRMSNSDGDAACSPSSTAGAPTTSVGELWDRLAAVQNSAVRIAVVGQFAAGKSTLLNGLLQLQSEAVQRFSLCHDLGHYELAGQTATYADCFTSDGSNVGPDKAQPSSNPFDSASIDSTSKRFEFHGWYSRALRFGIDQATPISRRDRTTSVILDDLLATWSRVWLPRFHTLDSNTRSSSVIAISNSATRAFSARLMVSEALADIRASALQGFLAVCLTLLAIVRIRLFAIAFVPERAAAIIFVFMSHRHGREPADWPLVFIRRNGQSAGVAIAG